jgi:hypothetical protein
LWWSVLLVDEAEVAGEKQKSLTQYIKYKFSFLELD